MNGQADSGFCLTPRAGDRLAGRFAALDALPGIAHLVTTRDAPPFGPHADSSATLAGVRAVGAALGVAQVAWCRQVHGDRVLRAAEGGLLGEADALVVTRPDLAVLGRSADCPLVLVASRRDGRVVAVGMAHASWRSTVARITERMLAELLRAGGGDATEVVAAICPSAGPCCYEVGAEVREAALAALGEGAAECFLPHGARWRFDLWRANGDQLLRAGVPAEAVHLAGLCTLCRNDLFPSHRREGAAAGRFAAAIAIARA